MSTQSTLEQSWVGALNEHPIRVEEHRIDLAYIVEFYDELSQERECITHCPTTGELLTVEELRRHLLETA